MSTTPNKLEKQYDGMKAELEKLRAFLDSYGSKIPDGLGNISLYNRAEFAVMLSHRANSDRDRALQVVGDIFGREGWTAKPEYGGQSFDWTKEIDGVRLNIYGAETLPKLEPMPVPPSKFPLQLADSN